MPMIRRLTLFGEGCLFKMRSGYLCSFYPFPNKSGSKSFREFLLRGMLQLTLLTHALNMNMPHLVKALSVWRSIQMVS